MAKSSARKKREKLEREGKRNPEQNRSIFAFADMRLRKTKTRAEKLGQQKHKRSYSSQQEDGLFYLAMNLFGEGRKAMEITGVSCLIQLISGIVKPAKWHAARGKANDHDASPPLRVFNTAGTIVIPVAFNS